MVSVYIFARAGTYAFPAWQAIAQRVLTEGLTYNHTQVSLLTHRGAACVCIASGDPPLIDVRFSGRCFVLCILCGCVPPATPHPSHRMPTEGKYQASTRGLWPLLRLIACIKVSRILSKLSSIVLTPFATNE